jgi:hypothetical protein
VGDINLLIAGAGLCAVAFAIVLPMFIEWLQDKDQS